MELEVQKCIAIHISYFFTFCVAVENGIVIPTILEYLHIFGISNKILILGLAFSGNAFASNISGRTMKYFATTAYSTRLLLLCCCLCYTIGGFTYAFGRTWWSVLIGRWLCGFGNGAQEVIRNDISKCNVDNEFDSMLRHIQISFLMGFLFAPLFSMIIISTNFHTSHIPNCAIIGLIFAIIFMVCGIFISSGCFDLGKCLIYCKLNQTISLTYERISNSKSYGTIPILDEQEFVNKNNGCDSDEECTRIHGLWLIRDTNLHKEIVQPPSAAGKQKLQTFLTVSDEILEHAEELMGEVHTPLDKIFAPDTLSTEEISTPGDGIVSELDYNVTFKLKKQHQGYMHFLSSNSKNRMLPHLLITAFLFSSIQSMLTPLTDSFFHFDGMDNALIQLLLVALCIVLKIILDNHSIPNRILGITGSIVSIISLGWLLVSFSTVQNGESSLLSFCVGMLGASLACCILYTSCSSDSEFNHGVWLTGIALGSIWTVLSVSIPRLLFGGQILLILIATVVNFLPCSCYYMNKFSRQKI